MNDKGKKILLVIVLLIIALVGGTYAFWTWTSPENKNVVFNTSNGLKEFIVYDEGDSKFVGDFQVADSYTGGVHTTVSISKTASASNVDFYATIYMDINEIGTNLRSTPGLKWTVTKGDSTSTTVVSSGDFVGNSAGDTLTLYNDIEVTTATQKFTIWLWIDSSLNPSDELSGETIDSSVWTQVNQIIEDKFEITKLAIFGNKIYATAVNSTADIVYYAVTNSNTTPTSWTTISTTDQNRIYSLEYTTTSSGTNYVWFKDRNNKVISKAVTAQLNYNINYYDVGGGEFSGVHGSEYPTSYEYGNTVTLDTPTKIGYSFAGYFTTEDGTGTAITEIASTQVGDVTLYAKWETATYTLSFNGNMFSAMNSQTINGLTFTYDYTNSYLTINGTPTATSTLITSFTGLSIADGDEYVLTLTYVSGSYAYTGTGSASFVADVANAAGTGNLSPRSFVSVGYPTSGNKTNTLNPSALAISGGSGFRFWMWATEPANQTFTDYKVKVNFIKKETLGVTYGKTYGNLPTPKRLGYTFAGWYTEENGAGTKITSSDTVSITNNTTLYAKWTPNTIYIMYKPNGGTVTASTTNAAGTTSYTWAIDSSGYITKSTNGSTATNRFSSYKYGSTSLDLPVYNNAHYLKITRTGYNAKSGAQWICESGCTPANKTYSQAVTTLSSSNELCNAENGNCTLVLKVNWVDNIKPTGSLTLTASGSTVTAKLTASDSGSGIKEPYGYLIQTSSTCPTTGYTSTSNTNYNFSITANGTYYVCARITDNAGNVAYISKSINVTSFVPNFSLIASNYSCSNASNGSNPIFKYTGECSIEGSDSEGWKIKLNTSGTMTFTSGLSIDAFLVGGGGGGGGKWGAGGGGGYTKTVTGISLSANTGYSVTIGAGGSSGSEGGSSSVVVGSTTYSVNGGKGGGTGNTSAGCATGGNGGSGGGGGGGSAGLEGFNGGNGGWSLYLNNAYQEIYCDGGTGQGSTTGEFGVPVAKLYGSGGAGSDGGQQSAGEDNTGDGGGGGTTASNGSKGGSGIVIIRATGTGVSTVTGSSFVDNHVYIPFLSNSLVGNMYRYQGNYKQVINNYICFGTSNKSTCTSTPATYMYRIIGVDSYGSLKLIKKRALSSTFTWANSADRWSGSATYNSLNGSSFLTNTTFVPSGWSGKIIDYQWRIGQQNTKYNEVGTVIYDYEIGSNATFNSYSNARVSLMYMHDFYLAVSSSISCGPDANNDYNCKRSWIHMDKNDSNNSEWTMSGATDDYAWAIDYSGHSSSMKKTTNSLYIRPVFFLNSSVQIIGGTGTESDPYIIG